MVKAIAQLQLLDVVALKEDLPDGNLLAGQVGTIVEFLAPEVYEVEFSDDDGQTYAMLPLHSSQLLQLKYTFAPETLAMSNPIYQYGQGDNVAGDKVLGDKVAGNKVDNSQTNNFNGPMSGVIGSDNANVTNNQFIQTNNANTAELLQLIASLRQTAAQFPEDVREEIIIDLEDVEAEIQKPETDRNKTKLKKRLAAILAAATATGIAIANITDFTNNVTDLAEKAGIELALPPKR
jgi:Domain of unknown function (DUF4926)